MPPLLTTPATAPRDVARATIRPGGLPATGSRPSDPADEALGFLSLSLTETPPLDPSEDLDFFSLTRLERDRR